MVTSKDKEKRGVGMQGFKYAPGLAEFGHIINIHSARAYRSIQNVLKLLTERSNQYVTMILLHTLGAHRHSG